MWDTVWARRRRLTLASGAPAGLTTQVAAMRACAAHRLWHAPTMRRTQLRHDARLQRAVPFLLVLALLIIAACTSPASTQAPAPTEASAVAESGPFVADAPADWDGGSIPLGQLPPEALEVLLLIADDGPYPYSQDGSTFQNREGILPDRPLGHYREFTVETPGSPDRGARRLVAGDDSEVYYTGDHYDSFSFVEP